MENQRLFPTHADNNGIGLRNWLARIGKTQRDNPDDTPADERVALVQKFKRDSEESSIRQTAVAQWQEADRFIDGEHWSTEDLANLEPYQTQLTINRIFGVQETRVAQMTENLTQIEVLARDAGDDAFAQELDAFLLHEWDRQGWSNIFCITLWQVSAHSMAFVKTYWDVHAEGGRGAVKLEAVSNYDIFIDPKAKIRDSKLISKFVIHRYEMTRNQILAAFQVDVVEDPLSNMNVPLNKDMSMTTILGTDETDKISLTGRPSTQTTSDNSRPPGYVPKKDTYEVLECWYMDDTLIESDEYDDVERPKQKLKYPNGRVITIANGRVLYDAPNLFGFFPFVPISERPMVDKLYPKSTINHIVEPQKEYNRRRSQISDHANLCCNPIMVISSMAALEQDTETLQRPGSRIVSMDGQSPDGGVRYLIPPPLGREVADGVLLAHQDIDEISGMHEVNRGDADQARSGIAIKELRQAGRTRTTWQSGNTDVGLKQVFQNVIAMYLDFVDSARKYRFIDPDSLEQVFGEFNPQQRVLPNRQSRIAELEAELAQLNAQVSQQASALTPEEADELEMYVQAETERLHKEIQVVLEMPASDLVSFDISLQTGTRHLTLQALASLSIQLYEMNIITAHTLLKRIKFPGWRKAIQLKQEEQAALAAAQQEVEEIQFERERQLQREKQENMVALEQLRGDNKIEFVETSTDGSIELQKEKSADEKELERLKGVIALKKERLKEKSKK